MKDSYEAKQRDPTFSPFLRHFGRFVAKEIETTELPAAKFILERIDELTAGMDKLNSLVSRLDNGQKVRSTPTRTSISTLRVPLKGFPKEQCRVLRDYIELASEGMATMSVYEDEIIIQPLPGTRESAWHILKSWIADKSAELVTGSAGPGVGMTGETDPSGGN